MLIFRNIKLSYHLGTKNLMIYTILQNSINPVDLSFLKYEKPNTINKLSPLFIMHGLFGSKRNWRSTCKAMIPKIPSRKIYALDARNHGDSPHTTDHRYEDMIGDLIQVMKRENLRKIVVVGHSMGGKCMMYMALKYPHLVEKAIIIDITPMSPSESLERLGTILYALKKVKVSSKLKIPYARKQADEQLQELGVKLKHTREFIITNLIQYPDGQYGWRMNVDALYKCFNTHIAKFPNHVLGLKYMGPALFIGGGEEFISEEQLSIIRQTYFADARLVSLPNTGHMVHVEQQPLLVDIVASFLQ